MHKILVINPNSTVEMTRSLELEISTLRMDISNVRIDFFTAPDDAPPSINNNEDGKASAVSVIDFFNANPEYYSNYDGYLVACYSDHPLVELLRKSGKLRKHAVVMGIFQASMIYAMNSSNDLQKSAILTSGKDWESILDTAICSFFSCDSFPSSKFVNTLAAEIPVLDLHKPQSFNKLVAKINHLLSVDRIENILLGCAGLSSVSGDLKKEFPNINFVDPVKTGILLLTAYMKIEQYT